MSQEILSNNLSSQECVSSEAQQLTIATQNQAMNVMVDPFLSELWTLQRKKEILKTDKSYFGEFFQSVKNLSDRMRQSRKVGEDINPKTQKQIEDLMQFCRRFRRVVVQYNKKRHPVCKSKNTKRHIQIIGQMHFSSDAKMADNGVAGISQEQIDIYLKYFLPNVQTIGQECAHITEAFPYKDYVTSTIESILKKRGNVTEKGNFAMKSSEYTEIEKYFQHLNMITFFGKQYFKKDNEEQFRKLLRVKFLLHKIQNASKLSNYDDYKLMTLGQKKFVTIEGREQMGDWTHLDIVKLSKYKIKSLKWSGPIRDDLDKNFLHNGVEYFLENSIQECFDKYFSEESPLFVEWKNQFPSDDFGIPEIGELYQEIYDLEYKYTFASLKDAIAEGNLLFGKDLWILLYKLEVSLEHIQNRNPKSEFISFFEYLLYRLYEYGIFEFRERNTIRNIEKYFPDTQKQVPIIFGSGHNWNWEKYIREHNAKNPHNRYSLEIIDLS